MVKCEGLKEDGSPCQFELLPVFKVCPICGRPTISPPQEDPPDDAILALPCPYRGNDGQICGNKIVQNQRFCENCGWRINPKVFQPGSRMCSGVNEMTKKPCDNIILPTTRFCSECGRPPDFDMNEEVTTLPGQERDVSNADSSHDTKAINGVGAPEPDEASHTNLAVTHQANLSKNSVLENTESKDTGTQNVLHTEETPSELHVQQTTTESMDNSWFRVMKDDLTEHGPWLSTQQQSMLPGPSMSDNSNAVKFPVQASDGSTVDREAYQGQHDQKNWVMVTSPQEIQSSEGTANLTENDNISDGHSPAAVTIPRDTETNVGDIVPDNKMEGSQTSSVPSQQSNGSASVTIDESEITIEIYEKEPKNLDNKVVVQELTPVIQQIQSLDVRNSSDPDKASTEQISAEHDQTIEKGDEMKAPVQESSSSAPKEDGDANGNAVDHNEGQNEEKMEDDDEIVVISADESEDSDTGDEMDDKVGTEGQQRKDRKHRSGKRKKAKEKYRKKKLRKENKQSDTSQTQETQEDPKKKPETKKRPEQKEEPKKITIKRLDESVKTIPIATSSTRENNAQQSGSVQNKGKSTQSGVGSEKTNKDEQNQNVKQTTVPSGTDSHPLQSISTNQTHSEPSRGSQKGEDITQKKDEQSGQGATPSIEKVSVEKVSSSTQQNGKDNTHSILGAGQEQWQKAGTQTRSMTSHIQLHLHALFPAEVLAVHTLRPVVHVLDPYDQIEKLFQMRITWRNEFYCKAEHILRVSRVQAKRLRYRYLVHCTLTLSKEYEFFYDAIFTKIDYTRSFDIPDQCKDHWFQYDGIIRRKPESSLLSSLLSRLGYETYEKHLKEDCIEFIRTCCPVWQSFAQKFGESWSGTEMLEMFAMFMLGLKRTYCNTTKMWYRKDANFEMFVGKVFYEILEPVLQGICNSVYPDVVAVMGFLCLWYRYSMPLEKSLKLNIFKALLLKPNYSERTCPQFDRIKEQFKGEIPLVQDSLTALIRSMKESDNPIWLYSIPLFHFLMDVSKPFQTVSDYDKHDARKSTWWGNVEIKVELDFLKGKSTWKVSETDILQTLIPLFEADYLLPRTFLAALTFNRYKESVVQALPVEVVLAGFLFQLRSYYIDDKKLPMAMMCLEKSREKLLSSALLEREQIIGNQIIHAYLTVKVTSDLLTEVMKTAPHKTDLVLRVVGCYVTALSIYELFLEKLTENDKKQIKSWNVLTIFDAGRKEITLWLQRYNFIRNPQKDDLGVWNQVLLTELPEGTIKVAFLSEVKEKLQETMFARTERTKEKFVDIYCENLEEFSASVQDILGKVVFEALEKGCVLEDTILKSKGAWRYGNLLSRLFEGSWKKRNLEDSTAILKFTLSWPSFVHFIKIFYQGEKSKLLSEECNFQLTQAASLVRGTLESLLDGTISIRNLKIVLDNEKGFLCTIQIMSEREKTGFKEDFVRKTIQLRDKELKKFKDVKSLIDGLIDACQHIDVDTSDLEKSIRKLEKMDEMRVCHLCTPGALDKIQNLNDYEPTITYFRIGEEILSELPLFLRCCKGMVFMGIWGKTGEKAVRNRDEPLSVEEMMEGVWQPAYEEWTNLGEEIRTGNITFREFYKHFKDYDNSIIKRELRPFIVGDQSIVRWIDDRLEQVEYQRVLEKCVDGARIILDVVETYDLQGDFSQIVLIEQMAEGDEMKMCDMNRSMIETCNLLRGMEIKQFNCLKEFISARPLVIWLRESMESLKELKVFVDLASISAGEGAMEVDKVKCLHAATTGYAPLIFNLGQECDCDRFLEKCKEVWRELASDPGLPKKLYDTHRELEWLKTVKKSHGSVEVTSMYQAEAINTVGIYRVGNITPGKQTTELTLNEVLELHVQEDEEGSRLRRKYDYKELHELQSKLMLVAGKAEQGKDDVDKFTLVLDSVVRLCNVYIKLVSAGCVLFTDWTARFLCDPDRKVCTFLRFAVDEGTQLKGRRSDTEDLGTIIPSLAKFMETCLEEWLKYIDEKREQYPLLNFFTIDQMVILQRELVKVGQNSEPSKLVYPLLCAVKRDCTKSDLITAMRQAKEDVEGKTMEVDVDDENVNEGNVEMDDEDGLTSDEVSEEAIFIEEMVKAGYSEGLAKKALQCTDADEIDQGIAWCMEHEDEVDMEVQSEVMDAGDMGGTSVDNEEVFEGWSTTGKSISSVTQDLLDTLKQDKGEVQDEGLVRDLQFLWNTFLSSISSSVDDYLSVEHLGLILQRLSQLESFQIERTFLPCFDVGVPNLLMCPQEEVLNTVISIYGHDNDQPLPQADEVLLCTPHTSLDELDIFMRRAIFNGGGRVHCLVNGDALDYEVSDKGERRLEKHMQNAKDQGIEYKLVVICCTEQEYRSRIVAALDKYRKPALPLMASEDIRNYILQKLAVENIVGSAKPAASVDFQKSSVRVVKSWRAGVGKTLYKQRMAEKIETLMMSSRRQTGGVITIPLHEREINVNEIMRILLEHTLRAGSHEPRLFHIDIYHEVQVGVDAFLFQLLILGCLTDSSGYVWRKLPCDLYLIETMPLLARDINMTDGRIKCMHKSFDILPDVICRSPQESLDILNGRKPADYQESDLLFDEKEFRGAVFQRPYQYLLRLDRRQNLSDVAPDRPEGDKVSCLQILLRHCGIRDPSWSELKHFVRFLNSQLSNFETSAYCSLAAAEDLPGFAQFVLRFLIQMSRDFATRSLQISEESTFQTMQRMETDDDDENVDETLQGYQMRRTWESSPHPYLFFNPDGHSLTFLGFNINRQSGDLVDTQTGQVLERAIMQNTLQQALHRNRVNLSENFDGLPRGEKIGKLCSVMGTEIPHDPDETYELTTDNVKKILAIYMRFRCDIPVIIMGETGCGKTRLIKFMCSLQSPPGVEVQNMVLMKVHGGTTSADILRKVEEAERKAQENMEQYGRNMFTVLFFDEANTTEAIGIIKEIMCDHSMAGKPIRLCNNLKIVAACNPYRKHSEELIKRLEQAGLGYHVDADKTTDRLGRVPMRRLVYRVQPLPQSMLPLVWDFGQLDTRVEEMYIKQMVLRYIRNGRLPPGIETVVSKILTVSQDFMRKQEDECSFVSLRDVERVLEVMGWFYQQSDGPNRTILFDLMNRVDDSESEEELDDEDEAFIDDESQNLDVVTRSLILALGVCYHACLKNRQEYRMEVSQHFSPPCSLPGGEQQMLEEITDCQDIFLDNVQLEQKNIARNQALKENLFMMVVCIELRIPLFLVGKPGSSKSLAKTIVTDAMQGNAAHKELFKYYKQVQMVSFQCSPLSVPEGIVGTFRQCAMYQKDKDLDRFVSVVVLDEVGLAEDSPRMPLKTLHPLLEDGCQGDETPEPYKKVAFIGISNWALDPAKMNRGILVQREVPDREDLKETAMGICSTERKVQKMIKPLIEPMADSYLELFNKVKSKREFFGLRDFYSLLKMVYGFAATYKKKPTWLMLKHSIMRNFGGFKDLDPVEVFQQKMTAVNKVEQPTAEDPDCSSAGLIQACLSGDSKESETRYLLLLTENYGALTVLQQKILTINNAITIFGSSFPSDQEYTQVCRNINRIKVCMETGSTVVLLNLENLYESLYDALNQYYVYFGGERYVDLGLGTHRVKCRVHKEFRLIVVAEKDIVYNKFPIPLINRLEKHFLTISNMLTPFQLSLADRLTQWAEDFAKAHVQTYQVHTRGKRQKYTVGDVFMGYHADTCASIILHVSSKFIHGKYEQHEEEIFNSAKRMLLWCATPDSLLRLQSTKLSSSNKELNEIYYKEQKHDSLLAYLKLKLRSENSSSLFAQVTTHSKLLSTSDVGELSYFLSVSDITLLTLQSFDTEQQFCRQIRNHLEHHREGESILIVQCDCGDQNSGLVACARYCIQDEINQQGEQLLGRIHVVFVIQLPRIAGGCFNGFQCGLWHSVHIDELRPPDSQMPTLEDMRRETVGALLDAAPYNISRSQEGENIDVEMSEETQDTEMTEEKLPVGVDDVVLIDEHPRAGQVPIVRKFNIGRLIFTCIHAALAKVKDTDRESARNTDRVKILLNLLHQKTTSGDKTFLSGLTSHLASLMKEKEEKLSAHSSTHWLEALATKADDISRAGTFRKTLDQCLADKVTPLLAGIIAYLDTNKNLDILASSDVESWKRKLWLQVINTTAATQIQYSMLMSPNQLQELQEFMVRGTKHDGHTFSALMPFSWLIFGLIEGILKTSREMDGFGDGLSKVKRASEIIRELPLGMLLTGTQGNIQEMVVAYISDFVYMVYPVTSTQEHQLVCENLHHGTRAALGQEIDGVISLYVGIHVAYHTASPRLTNYSYIQSVWPDCSTAIIETQQKNPHYFLISEDEFTLDVMGLDLMLKNLVPSKEGLNTVQGRSSWVRLVHKYRPVVERILGYFTEKAQDDESNIGPKCLQGVENIRKQWTRVIVMKLFIEHVCTTDEHSLTVKRCMPFWIMLKEDVDLKNLKSVETVEKFLKLCNKDAVSQFFAIGKQENCRACESVIEERPVTLPCGHVVCLKCFNDTKIILKTYECPVCSEKFQEDFETSDEDKDRAKLDQYNDYRKRCNSFFMEVVSQLCFAHGTPPSVDVIKKLLNYITRQPRKGEGRRVTKELSVFDDGLDPNPVFRSFLLQLMIRTSTEDVTEHLESYLKEAQDVIKEGDDNDSHLVDLSLLVIQCLEDSYHNEAAKMEKPGSAEIKMATNLLTHNTNRLMVEELSVNKLYCLAEIRYGLTIAAKYLHENLVITKKTQKKKLDPHVRRLLDAVGKLCEECGSKWPKVFFVKYICRYYGTEVYQEIHKMKEASITRWVTIPELHQNKVVECSDRFIVCGDTYKTIREKLTHAALNSDAGKLQKTLQTSNRQQTGQTQIVTILALYREVTLSNLYPEQQCRFSKQAMEVIKEFLTQHDLFKSRAQFVSVLCNNTLWRNVPNLNIAEGMDLRVQNTVCLIIHVLVTLIYLPGETTFIEPLRRIATQPQRMKNAMLPTMPQDDVAEIKEALLAARSQNSNDNPVFYRCPNGHPYVIGDCGRPYYLGICKDCGAKIGGQGHKEHPGNVKIEQWLDQTQTGHILGRADHRKTQAIPERKMTSAQCAVLRLLTHVAMFLGANENPQAILEMIKPDIDPPGVYDFLWSHIEVDITTLRNLLGKSTDDVILLLHHICQQILENHGQGERKSEEMCGLVNKEERGKWEEKFCEKFLAKPLQEFEKKLKDLNKAVLNDQRLGADPLLCLLFETDSPAEMMPNTCLHGNPAVWRYRAKISMEHLSNTFMTQMSHRQPVLRMFLEEEHHLRAIRMVPSIIKLQKFLVQKYQRKLAKAEATTLTIAEMVEQLDNGEGQVDDVEMLIHDFTEAWDNVREDLLKLTLPTSLGIATVPKEYCRRPIDYRSSVSQLLPSQKEAGLSSYGLLYFLLKKQNSFLEKYCKIKKVNEKNVHRVQLSELTAAHLISYHPEHDILPMVLANCNYSFEVGQGTKIEYNFRDFERQLTDRFLFSKSFVDIPVQQFEMMTYRSESTNAVVFERLREKIGQEPLSAAVRHQICEEFRMYTDLCDCLDRLDITISFLKSVGCGEDVKIEYFMTQTLKMENPIPSQKARQSSLCRHVQSLWLTLAMQKTKNQASYKHDTFEGVGDELREDLTEEQREVVRGFCEELQLEKLEVLLETLWECIMLRISVPQNPDDEDYIDTTKFSLRDVMIGYMDNPGYSTELDFPDWLKELTNRMPESDSPNTILASQAVDSWLFLYSLYGQKSQERRY